MTTEAANLDLVAAMTVFTIRHLHAIAGSAPEARNGMTPSVAAVAADAVLFVNAKLVGFTVFPVTFGAGQSRAPRMNCVREPDIGWLPGIDEPRCFLALFQIGVHKNGLGRGTTQFVRVASDANIRARNAAEFAIAVDDVATVTLRESRFFRVCFVVEIQRLLTACVKSPGKGDPTDDQSDCEPEPKETQISPHD